MSKSRTLVVGLVAVFAAIATVAMPSLAQTSASEPKSSELAVAVSNQSEPVLCAEKDNVAIGFQSDDVRTFQIEAAHPVYLNTLQRDSIAADWTSCDFKGDPVFNSDVKVTTRQTLYETPDLWVVGWKFPSFWRPATTPFRVGGKTFEGLHLVQIWTLRPLGGEEILVVYPQDGYWRLRPKAPTGRDLTAFGSSVLIGPVTDAGRPIVDLKDIAFDPAAKSFALQFKRGGSAEVKISVINDQFHVLDVAFDKPVRGVPFAMLRSMYVTDFNNDAAQIAIKPANALGWKEAPVMAFKDTTATSVWLGRTTISRHNSSSPDHVLRRFSK